MIYSSHCNIQYIQQTLMQVYYPVNVVLTLSRLFPHHHITRCFSCRCSYNTLKIPLSPCMESYHYHSPCCAELSFFFSGAMRSEPTYQILMYIFCIHIIIHSMWAGWLKYAFGKTWKCFLAVNTINKHISISKTWTTILVFGMLENMVFKPVLWKSLGS